MLDIVCPTCGKRFDFTVAKEGTEGWEYSYDKRECWINSEEYMAAVKLINEFIIGLDNTQLRQFVLVYELHSEYYNILTGVIKNRLKVEKKIL